MNTDINTVLACITGVITAMGGFEFIKWLFTRKSHERISAASAFDMEYKSIMADYQRVQDEVDANKKQIDELNKKIDELYSKVHKLENDKLDLIKENNDLRLQLKEAEKHVCLQPDDRCLRRLNDNVKCRLVGLLRGSYTEDHPDAILTDEDMRNTPLKQGAQDNDDACP